MPPHRRNSKLYLVINVLQNLWFIEAVWYFFFINFVTYFQIGIIFAVSTLIGIIAEIPTGTFADKYGRKPAVVIGCFILSLGWGLMATTTGFWQFLIGSILSGIGRAFVSGALDAVVYDTLPNKNKEKLYQNLVTLNDQLTIFLFSITVIIGGFLYSVYFRLPHLLFAASNFLAFIASLFLVESHSPATSFDNSENVFSQHLAGFKQFKNVNLLPFLIPGISTLAFFYLYDWGFSKPTIALNAGFHVQGQAVIYAFLSIINIIGIRFLPKLRQKFPDKQGIIILNLLMGFGFILGSFKLGYLGIIALIAIELAGYINKPWLSIAVNKNIESHSRATTLSTLEFISKIPYLFTNIILGSFLDSGHANPFHFTIGLTIIIAAICSYVYYQARTKPLRVLARE